MQQVTAPPYRIESRRQYDACLKVARNKVEAALYNLKCVALSFELGEGSTDTLAARLQTAHTTLGAAIKDLEKAKSHSAPDWCLK